MRTIEVGGAGAVERGMAIQSGDSAVKRLQVLQRHLEGNQVKLTTSFLLH